MGARMEISTEQEGDISEGLHAEIRHGSSPTTVVRRLLRMQRARSTDAEQLRLCKFSF